ncbi:methyltransferase domain-containing protein [Alicyclobacillaceae bacterium I2511]|nr:methyltransferase domain-containing protein [Alicyclobacillaceae bacterium I2511]
MSDVGLYGKIDAQYEKYLINHGNIPERWLLEQTILTGPSRRGILKLLPIQAGAQILDIGTGFGALAFDIAATLPVTVTAVDADPAVLHVANALYQQMGSEQCFLASSQLSLIQGDAYQLPFPDATFDFVLARFVYQHLQNPRRATDELARVLKPEGHVCVMDVDDQWTLTYPEDNGALAKLRMAVGRLQSLQEGDRFVGRKLANYLYDAGLSVVGSVIYPEAQFTTRPQTDPGMALTFRRFQELRQSVLDHGLMCAEEFDGCLEEVRTGTSGPSFHASGLMVVLGRKLARSSEVPL